MKLVIFFTDKRARMTMTSNPLEISLQDFPKSTENLEEYGRTWAKFWPTDIVMLVEENA